MIDTHTTLEVIKDDDREMRLLMRTAQVLARQIGADNDFIVIDDIVATARAQAEEEIEEEEKAAAAVTVDLEHDGDAYRRGYADGLRDGRIGCAL